ncbi:conserved hypothetical protein [Photorhabdus asymbiotica]|uniref:Uncharacterized protein n=1 Tax=Photorhabdus asymbiotica subsp. asymbiotica (strain ATCC 43949 / 3105-77) TaxID=553480 RepID=C7BTL0_PHOAA|nr:hypothetical protein [Photorhabdus asymbiotica]CAQ83865.1 conserved hypothetical protein [Photorhabdus asymbiotica]
MTGVSESSQQSSNLKDEGYSDFIEVNLNTLHSSFCSKELKNKLEREIIRL